MIDNAVIKCFREVEHIVRGEDYAAHAFSHICSHVIHFKYKDERLRGTRDEEQGNRERVLKIDAYDARNINYYELIN